MMKKAGSGSASGSISQRHGSADPDPDPHQNVKQHCFTAVFVPKKLGHDETKKFGHGQNVFDPDPPNIVNNFCICIIFINLELENVKSSSVLFTKRKLFYGFK
jgi:hypothetical protein